VSSKADKTRGDEKKEISLEERELNREKLRALKFYHATRSVRGAEPRMKKLEALVEVKKVQKYIRKEKAIEFCNEVIAKLESQLSIEEKEQYVK